jgi:hypothetical protein
MQELFDPTVLEDEITITFKDEGRLPLDDLTQFLYLFETVYIATGSTTHQRSPLFKMRYQKDFLKIGKVERSDVTVRYEPMYGGFHLEPFECNKSDIQTFESIFSNAESNLLNPIDTDLVHRLSRSEKDMWIEIALDIRKNLREGQLLLSPLQITRMTYCSPPKITFKNITCMLAATICLTGGKINLSSGEAEVNGISNAIINLKNALVGEEALAQTDRNCVNHRSEMKDNISILTSSLPKNTLDGLKNDSDDDL